MYLMNQRHSVLEIMHYVPFHGIFPFNSLNGKNRLGNPSINFPIGMVFGDSDFFGSEGADEIIKGSKQFASGRS